MAFPYPSILLSSVVTLHTAVAGEIPIYLEEAEKLAGQPYVPGWTPPTEFTKSLTYDQLRKIHIKRPNWLFNDSGSNVQVEPLLAGSFNSKGLQIGVMEQGRVRTLPFSAAMFEFPEEMKGPEDKDLSGFKGFRVHGAPRTGAGSYEQFSFGGASYFRGHAEGLNYGLSARGLILRRDGKEEFPMFERFVFEEPAAKSSVMVWHALLNSPSVTGAFRFTSLPGNPHVMEIQADLFPRSGLAWDDLGLGLAGFSSMYWFSPADARRTADFRGRVHDSEALAIDTEGGRAWRVLGNPSKVRTSTFPVKGLHGFGLIQRGRSFDSYQDETARYERRTSAWVEPVAGMTEGEVKLVEIPTRGEYDDNIVAYFAPNLPAGSREPLHLSYRLQWCDDAPVVDGPRVVQTRIGKLPDKSGITLVTVDFATALPVATLKPQVDLPAAVEQRFAYLKMLPDGKTVRLHLGVVPKAGESTGEIRAKLLQNDQPVGETWVYPWAGAPES